MNNDQPTPNLEAQEEGASRLEGLLEIVGLEVTAESVRAGTHSEIWRKGVPDSEMRC